MSLRGNTVSTIPGALPYRHHSGLTAISQWPALPCARPPSNSGEQRMDSTVKPHVRPRRRGVRIASLAAVATLVGSILILAPNAHAGVDLGWSGWGEVPGNGFTPDAPAAVGGLSGITLVVRGTDNRIYYSRWRLQYGYTAWSEVQGAGRTPSAPAVNSFGPKIYVRGTDNRIYAN